MASGGEGAAQAVSDVRVPGPHTDGRVATSDAGALLIHSAVHLKNLLRETLMWHLAHPCSVEAVDGLPRAELRAFWRGPLQEGHRALEAD
eukprot:4531266-Pyramimonas_sp.AAC.1